MEVDLNMEVDLSIIIKGLKKVCKKIIDNIDMIILILLIFLTTFLIGTPIYEKNAQTVYFFSSIFSIVYFIKAIIKKEKIIDNTLDIFMCILIFSTLIPLVFGTFASLDETIHIILKYFCVLNFYFIAKNEYKKDDKNIKVIVNTIIISICILCVIGLDDINNNYLKEFKEFINYFIIENDENRVMSLFAYPNTMAIVIGAGIYLTLGNLFDSKAWKSKIFYALITIFFGITLILTYSRLAYIIFFMTIICYSFVIFKKYNIKRFLNKKSITLISVVCLLFLIYIVIGLKLSDNLIIKEDYQKILYTVEPNTEYNFKFNIEEVTDSKIQIIEKNRFFDEIIKTEKYIKEIGEVEIPIYTSENTSVIYIYIENNEDLININKAYINNEELILKYKLLPTFLVDKIKSISFSNKSAWERFVFIQDALKLIKEHWLFGLGGNAWRVMQTQVQDYMYYTREVHCFPVQIFLENGIIGFIACVLIGIWLVVNLVLKICQKDINMYEISIFFAIIIVILHSLLDFSLSFFYVLVIVVLMMAMLSNNKKELKQSKGNIIFLILIIACLFNIEVSLVEKYYSEKSHIIVVNENKTEIDVFENYNKLLPFNKEVKQKLYKTLNSSSEKDYDKMKKILLDIFDTEKFDTGNISLINVFDYINIIIENNSDITDSDFELILNTIDTTKDFSLYHTSSVLNRWQNFKLIIFTLQIKGYSEYSQILKEKLNEEIIANEKYVLDYENGRYSESMVEEYKRTIDDMKLMQNN